MTAKKPLRWLLFSVLFYSLLLATGCSNPMDNHFAISGSPDILKQLKINVLYLDNNTTPLLTYYNKGEVHTHQSAVEGYVLYINYNDVLFFRAYCDLNPDYFAYSKRKSITIEQVNGKFYANIVFLKSQEEQQKRYDSSTEMHSFQDAMIKYQNDFSPIAWSEQLSLEKKFRLTLSPKVR
jgi:hypothetical protein